MPWCYRLKDSPYYQSKPKFRIMSGLGLRLDQLRADDIPNTISYEYRSCHEALLRLPRYICHAHSDNERNDSTEEAHDRITDHGRSSMMMPRTFPYQGTACDDWQAAEDEQHDTDIWDTRREIASQ